jgi:hypothetical protein
MLSDCFFEQETVLDDTSISLESRKRCIIGNAQILKFVKGRTVDALCPLVLPSKSCSSDGKCKKREKTIKNLPVWRTEESMSFGIFRSGAIPLTETLCSQCCIEVKQLTERTRYDFWKLLPTFFGLPNWSEIVMSEI